MGILKRIKHKIDSALGLINEEDERNKIGLYILADESDTLVGTFRLSTNNFDTVHLYVSNKQRCTVEYIETVTKRKLYTVHAHDKNGKVRKFKREKLT